MRAERSSPTLDAVAAEMARQREIHPDRPKHPYHWATVASEEGLEVLHALIGHWLEATRLSQDQAAGATVELRLAAARQLHAELVQVAAVAAAWAETLPASATTPPSDDRPAGRPEVRTETDRASTGRQDDFGCLPAGTHEWITICRVCTEAKSA